MGFSGVDFTVEAKSIKSSLGMEAMVIISGIVFKNPVVQCPAHSCPAAAVD